MPYWLKGNAEQFWLAFNQRGMIKKEVIANISEQDLAEAPFLGSYEEALSHYKCWKDPSASEYYKKENISAGNLRHFASPADLFKKKEEDLITCLSEIKHHHMAFINNENEFCGLSISYRSHEKEPTQWMFGLVVNTNLAPKDRTIVVLTNCDPQSFIKNPNTGLVSKEVGVRYKSVRSLCSHGLIDELIQGVLTEDYSNPDIVELNQKIGRITCLTQSLNESDAEQWKDYALIQHEVDLKLLLAENKALDLLQKYQLKIPFALLKECLEKENALRKKIEQFALTKYEAVNKSQLAMILEFYAQGVLDTHADFIKNTLFPKVTDGWDDAYIKVLGTLMKRKISETIIQNVSAEKPYYTAVYWLEKLGLMQDFAELFDKPAKRDLLLFIDSIKEVSLKKLCLLFWVKDNLTQEEYKRLVHTIEDNPLFAKTLLEREALGTLPAAEFKKMAFNRIEVQKLVTEYQFKGDFGIVTDKILSDYDEPQLEAIRQSMKTLHKTENKYGARHQAALSFGVNGRKLRIFLPELLEISDASTQKTLVNILYFGIEKGLLTQSNEVKKLRDPQPVSAAKNLHERFVCVTHLLNLDFDNKYIELAAMKTEKAERFREAILKIHEKLEVVRVKMRASVSDKDYKNFERAEKEYKKNMYDIVFNGLTIEEFDYKNPIACAENALLKHVDPENRSWLQYALIIIANIVISALTVGVANWIKKSNTGNYWFFTQTPSGEKLRDLDKTICHLISP